MFLAKNPIGPWSGLKSLVPMLLAVLLHLGASGSARANLVIVPTFDSTITGDPNAATIESTINNLIAIYEASFSDSVTVTITFQEMSTGLGQSSTYYKTSYSYSSFRSRLVSHASTANDAIALAHLPATTANPVNGSTTVELTLPNARALGISGSSPPAGQTDSIIGLNMSLMNLSRSSINPSLYDLESVAAHEINEVLGLSSALDGLNNGDPAPTGDVGTLDLFRYDSSGNRSFNTTATTQAYFSLDGIKDMVQYNQNAGGDFHDWFSYPYGGSPPRVQDAFGTPGVTPDLTVELIGLDVIGYHLLVPTAAIAKVSTNKESISWSPATPGFYLVENTNLPSTNWVATVNGTNNPVIVTNTAVRKFYRVFHP